MLCVLTGWRDAINPKRVAQTDIGLFYQIIGPFFDRRIVKIILSGVYGIG